MKISEINKDSGRSTAELVRDILSKLPDDEVISTSELNKILLFTSSRLSSMANDPEFRKNSLICRGKDKNHMRVWAREETIKKLKKKLGVK